MEIIYERLGGDVSVDGLGVPELADPCVFVGVDDEGAETAFGGFVLFEIIPQQFVGGIGAGVDNRIGVIGEDQLDHTPCGRVKHLDVSRFIGSVRKIGLSRGFDFRQSCCMRCRVGLV